MSPPKTDSSSEYLQTQINDLREKCVTLTVIVGKADELATKNDTSLDKLSAQVQTMGGTIEQMRKDLPTKDDLNEVLTVTLNKYIARGFWGALGFGALWLLKLAFENVTFT